MKITIEHAKTSLPVVKRAIKESGMPPWVRAAFASLGKYGPTILMLIAQILPLIAAGSAAGAGSSGEPDIDPAALRAIRAYREGNLDD